MQVKVDVEGELIATAGRDIAPVRQPISVAGRFDFVEAPGAGESGPAAIRAFNEAEARLVVDGHSHESILGEDARLVHVARQGTAAVSYLPEGFLSREEHDLLDIPFDPLLLDELRATKAVAGGEAWDVPADITAGLLAIDTVERGTIEAKLDHVADLLARVTLSGTIDGAIDGVPTHLVIQGSCTIQASPDISSDEETLRYRLDGRVSNVSVTVRERRQPGHVAPGFDVEARVAVTRGPCSEAEATTAAIKNDLQQEGVAAGRRRGEGRPGVLLHRDPGGRFELVHDARWRTVQQEPGMVVMRYVDHGALVAQCTVTALPPAPASSVPTVEEVQRDIGRSLEGQFERFEGASQARRDDGVTVVRVVSAGSAGSLPFHWVHAVLADESGRRASVAFMMEATLAKRFADADLVLVEGLRLGSSPGGEESQAREARLPRKTAVP